MRGRPARCEECGNEAAKAASLALTTHRRSRSPFLRPAFPSCSRSMASTTVYVGNVEATVDEFTLKSIFENCGAVVSVRLAG